MRRWCYASDSQQLFCSVKSGAPNNQFEVGVRWKNHFPCKDLWNHPIQGTSRPRHLKVSNMLQCCCTFEAMSVLVLQRILPATPAKISSMLETKSDKSGKRYDINVNTENLLKKRDFWRWCSWIPWKHVSGSMSPSSSNSIYIWNLLLPFANISGTYIDFLVPNM